MGIIQPTNTSVQAFKGLHLYHFGLSNCAMRVRIALEEKNLPWTSHVLDLMKGENRTADYFGINPNGVVPTLVDDGVVIIDSSDIIDYLDKKFSPNSLRPETQVDQELMYEWMYLARDNHLSLKTYMYSNMKNASKMKKTEQEMADYRTKQSFDTALLDFHERFNSDEGFSQQELEDATAVIDQCFTKMDERLQTHDWLAGDRFSLADIAWIPQLIVLKAANYPFEKYKNFEAWKNAVIERPSFQKGVLAWLPEMNA